MPVLDKPEETSVWSHFYGEAIRLAAIGRARRTEQDAITIRRADEQCSHPHSVLGMRARIARPESGNAPAGFVVSPEPTTDEERP
jgi:hypothetical protein